MIYYIVTREHAYTMGDLIRHWAHPVNAQIRIFAVDRLADYPNPPRATYLFADLDRYSPEERAAAALAASRLRTKPGNRVLNHPGEVLDRLTLLRTLYADGANSFRAHAFPLAPTVTVDLPAFVRRGSGHDGPVGALVTSRSALEAAGQALQETAGPDVVAIEFRDTRCADGLYRKYSCFRVGDAIIPRHLLFSQSWVTKTPDILTPALAEEELAYVASNPHEAEVLAVFQRAGIDYGRIDYAVRPDGSGLEVWEINTNPYVAKPPGSIPELRRQSHALAVGAIQRALSALDVATPPKRIRATRPGEGGLSSVQGAV